MHRTLIAWDIENIKFSDYKQIVDILGDIEKTDKFFTHNKTHPPIKKENSNFLTNRGWSRFLVKPGKDSADNSISDIIQSNIDKYSRFVIITGDSGFSDIISYLLNNNKEVVLVHNEKSDKLINKIHSKIDVNNINTLLTTFSL